LKVLFIGDIVGEPGRKMLKAQLRGMMDMHRPDLVIANGENAAGGFGITSEIADELLFMGIDVLTSGNHVWTRKRLSPILPNRTG
jgi:calcineurin-like phosphoesterase